MELQNKYLLHGGWVIRSDPDSKKFLNFIKSNILY